MRKLLVCAAMFAAGAAAPAAAQPANLLTAATLSANSAGVGMTKATLVEMASPEALRPKRQPLLIEFAGADRPGGLSPDSAARIASNYCLALRYAQGRALQLSKVGGGKHSFAYTAVDRVLCFD